MCESVVVEEFFEFGHTLNVTEYLEEALEVTGVEFSIDLSSE